MKLNIRAVIFGPTQKLAFGGENPPVFNHSFSTYLELTPDTLKGLLNGGLDVEGMPCKVHGKYDVGENLIVVQGALPSEGSKEKKEELVKKGWVADEDACKYYGI